MSTSIRFRLLLLVLSLLLPAVVAAVWVIAETYDSERAANERTLRETTRALSMVVDGELERRTLVARMLSLSSFLDSAPDLTPADLAGFDSLARSAMEGLNGWVELNGATGQLFSTHVPHLLADKPNNMNVTPASRMDLVLREFPLLSSANGHHVTVTQPVQRQGKTLLNLNVTLLPQELHRLLAEQKLPPDWKVAVLDRNSVVVARHPGGVIYQGVSATADLKAHLKRSREGFFESVSLDGDEVMGFFSTSAKGWTYVLAMPRTQFLGWLPQVVLPVMTGALILLVLGVGNAMWVSRSIARSVVSLKRIAAKMQAGHRVEARRTGITECDEVGAALASAAGTILDARIELEGKVAQAVEAARLADQRISHGQRMEALGRLTGGVAHDFNNLLGVISNSAHLIARYCPDKALQVPLAATWRAIEVGSRLTQHLSRFSGRQPVRPEVVDLQAYFNDVEELLRMVLGKSVRVHTEVAAETRRIQVDASELELALINLALNARDAMPQGGQVTFEARNARHDELDGKRGSPFVVIMVTDNGCGIDQTLTSRVFEPFFTTKTRGAGTGLGLSQVHGFCVQAGGMARLKSTPGQGTSVSMLLPARQGEPRLAHVALRQQDDGLHGRRVMLVEDNETLGDVTAAVLEGFGAQVIRAETAEAALLAINAGDAVDLVLSDVVMPGTLDGLALAQTLASHHPAISVVLTTGYSSSPLENTGFTVLRKPCPPELLVRVLRDALKTNPGASKPTQ
jgi:signal transduction histidine kinase/CheY-like chemotaxis protein